MKNLIIFWLSGICVAAGQDTAHINLNFQDRPAGLLGQVWHDLNSDGQMDFTETGVFGVPVEVQYPLGTTVASTTTWFDGWFEFLTQDYPQLDQYPVIYLIPYIPPQWTVTAPPGGYFSIAPTDWMQAFYIGVSYPAAIQGHSWHDVNGDGIWQTDTETGWESLAIQIREPSTGNLVGTTQTDADGYYSFVLPPQDPGECTAPSNYDMYDPCYLVAITTEPWCCYATWDYDCDILYSDCFFGNRERTAVFNGADGHDDILPGRNRTYSELEIYEIVPDNLEISFPTSGYYTWTRTNWGSELDFGNAETICGDGLVEAGEECDDGNLVNYDGCDSGCQIEGDLLNDGVLNITDIVLLVGLITGQQPYNPEADVNGDGQMNVADIVQIISWILG